MAEPKKTKKSSKFAPTQAYLPIEEIRENLVVLRNNKLVGVLLVRGADFGLKSEAEQNAIINSYKNFLNSLEFPIQILVRSKKIDLDSYLKRIESLQKSQTNELLRFQTLEYLNFLTRLIESANVVTKEFYVVVSYTPAPLPSEGLGIKLIELFSKIAKQREEEQFFEKNKATLEQRIKIVKEGLEGLGLKVVQLRTEELIELFYNIYNPGLAYQQKLTDIQSLTSAEIIEKLE